jgi:hypothetical protein
MNSETQNLHSVKVDYPEAIELSDLISIHYDLKFTLDTLALLKSMFDSPRQYPNEQLKQRDEIFKRSLWTSALITYVSCFSSGKRYGLTTDIFNSDPQRALAIQCHEFYKNIRDKSIAHSVNPFEDTQILIALSDPSKSPKGILGIAHLHRKRVGEGTNGLINLLKLSTTAFDFVKTKMKQYEDIVLKKASEMPIDDLYKLPSNKSVIPHPSEAGKAR